MSRMGHALGQVSHEASSSATARSMAPVVCGLKTSFATPGDAVSFARHSVTVRSQSTCAKSLSQSPKSSSTACSAMVRPIRVSRPWVELRRSRPCLEVNKLGERRQWGGLSTTPGTRSGEAYTEASQGIARQRAPSARRRAVDRLSIVRRTPCTFSIPLRRLPQGEAHIRIGAACQGFQAPIPSDPSVVRTSVRHVNSNSVVRSQA